MLKKPHVKNLDKNSLLLLISGITIWCVSVLGTDHIVYQLLFCVIGLSVMALQFDGTKKFLDKSAQLGYAICSIVIFGTLFFYVLTQTMFNSIIFTMVFGLVGIALLHRIILDHQRKTKETTLNSKNEV